MNSKEVEKSELGVKSTGTDSIDYKSIEETINKWVFKENKVFWTKVNILVLLFSSI